MSAVIRIIGTIAFVFVVYLALRAVADVLFGVASEKRRFRDRRLRIFSRASRASDVQREPAPADDNGRR